MSLKDFWRTVLQRAAEIVEELPGNQYCRRAEVYQPDVKTFVNDDVLVFYVSVNDVLGSQIEHSSNKLEKNTHVEGRHSQFINSLTITKTLFFFYNI